jgi:hypothetical protein
MARNETAIVYRLEAKTQKLEKDLNKAKGKLKRFQGQSKSISAGINKSMVGMFSVFSAGIIARDIFQTVTGFEKQMDKVQAISGATSKQMEALSDSAVEIGRASKFTAREIGNLQEELARLGFTSKQIIASTDAIRKLATAADAELGESAKILASTLNAFNIEAERSDEIANVMAESFSKSALDLDKFGVAMANVGATAKAAGFSMSDTTAMIGTLVDSGIDASKAGTDLRKIFTELSLQNITLEEAFGRIQNSTDKVKTAFELFGQRAQTSAIILAENTEKLGKLQGALGDSNMELDEMVGIMEDNLITDLQKLKSAWDGFILSIEDGEGSGVSALRSLTEWTTQLLNAMSGNQEAQADLKGFSEEYENGAESAKAFTESIKGAVDEQQQLAKWAKLYNKEFGETASIAEYWESKGFLSTITERQKELANETAEANKAFDDLNQNFEEFLQKEERLSKGQSTAPKAIGNLSSLGTGSDAFQNSLNSLNGGFQLSGGNADELFAQQKEKIQEKYADFTAFMVQQNEMLNATIRDSMAAGISGFADGIATGGIEQALNNIALVFAEGISKIGDQLITYGITMIAAKKALTNPFTNPAVAIAAGIAAKIAASALRGAIESNSANIASGGGAGGGGGSGSFQNNIGGQSIQLGGKLEIDGKDLVYIFNENTRGNARLQG